MCVRAYVCVHACVYKYIGSQPSNLCLKSRSSSRSKCWGLCWELVPHGSLQQKLRAETQTTFTWTIFSRMFEQSWRTDLVASSGTAILSWRHSCLKGYLAISGDIFDGDSWGTTGLCWEVARDAAKSSHNTRQPSQQKTVWSRMLIVVRLRTPALGQRPGLFIVWCGKDDVFLWCQGQEGLLSIIKDVVPLNWVLQTS